MEMKNFVHKPVQLGECAGCHDPHQSDYRFMLREDPAQKLCLECHKDEAFMKRKYLHGPVAAGACILCHDSHSSWNPKLVLKRGRDLCLFCHTEIDEWLKDARHIHPPVQKDCQSCHDPHASDYPMQVREDKRKLCGSCHKDIAKLIDTSKHVHGAVLNGDGCGNCHNVHATTLPRLLRKPLLETCLGCHNKEIEVADGKKLADMATLLKDNPDHHGPIRQADCSACHNPHASPNFRLLRKVYPEFFYAPFDLGNYDLCFQCHMRDMVLVKYGKGLTRFKNGELNLHFVHVNKQTKGRTCRACHEVHASKRPVHIRDKVPFGPKGWQFDLNFEKTENGGKCAPACHKPLEYVRAAGDTVVPQSQPAPTSAPVERKAAVGPPKQTKQVTEARP